MASILCQIDTESTQAAGGLLTEVYAQYTTVDGQLIGNPYHAHVAWTAEEIRTAVESGASASFFATNPALVEGMVERSASPDAKPLALVEQELLNHLAESVGVGVKPILAANSVASDKALLGAAMPRFSKAVHYKIVDWSSIKELVRDMSFDFDKGALAESHRADSDVEAAIAEGRAYYALLAAGLAALAEQGSLPAGIVQK